MVDIFAVIDPADVDRLLENARRRAGENLSLMFQHVLSPRHKRPFTTEARPYDYHRKVKPRAPEPNSAPFFQRLPPELVPEILAKLLPSDRDVTEGRMLLSVYIGRQLYLLDLVCRFFGWPLAEGLSPTESLARMACSKFFNVETRAATTGTWKQALGELVPADYYKTSYPKTILESMIWGLQVTTFRCADPQGDINRYWGCTDPELEQQVRAYTVCVDGESEVLMADGSTRPVRTLRRGDVIRTGHKGLAAPIAFVYPIAVNYEKRLCHWRGAWISGMHPIWHEGQWCHADELAPREPHYISRLYDFELGGVALAANDHSILVCNSARAQKASASAEDGDFIMATLGASVGPRLEARCPGMDGAFGSGYWQHKETAPGWVQFRAQCLAELEEAIDAGDDDNHPAQLSQ
eukprot:GAFH01001382.1.p2 GENE.GAFH01001382.1~~GAFH01001382.1.p2  ORF type:complete len:409 (+),score=89.24 GAFH01001382.1:256-1482(+)